MANIKQIVKALNKAMPEYKWRGTLTGACISFIADGDMRASEYTMISRLIVANYRSSLGQNCVPEVVFNSDGETVIIFGLC